MRELERVDGVALCCNTEGFVVGVPYAHTKEDGTEGTRYRDSRYYSTLPSALKCLCNRIARKQATSIGEYVEIYNAATRRLEASVRASMP